MAERRTDTENESQFFSRAEARDQLDKRYRSFAAIGFFILVLCVAIGVAIVLQARAENTLNKSYDRGTKNTAIIKQMAGNQLLICAALHVRCDRSAYDHP